MFSKNNLKYILILVIGFLWCSSLYLTQEQYLLNYLSSIETNLVDMLFGSLSMALGIILFIVLYKKNKNVKLIYTIFLILTILLSVSFFLISSKIILSIILCLVCIIGSAGFGSGYHFSLVANNVDKKYRARVFTIGYALGAIGTYLIAIIPNNMYKTIFSLILYIPLIIFNIYLINKCGNLSKLKDDNQSYSFKNYIFVIVILIFLMAIVTSFSSTIFSIKNINLNTGFAYPRLYYSIGLILAGIIADKKQEYLEVATIVSLFFPLIAIFLIKENISMLLIASLNYVFLAFFVVFRTIVFMNLKDKKLNLIYLAALGLCVSRFVEGLIVLVNYYFKLSYLFLVISSVIILSVILIIYILFYHKKFEKSEDEIIKEIKVQYKLSIQETKVLELLINDYTNQEIADELFLSINTIRNHVANIYKKTNMKKNDLKEICILKTI